MSADNMPPLPIVGYSVTFKGEHVGNLYGREDTAQDQKRERDHAFGSAGREVLPLVTEADARAYAAEQTRELVEALELARDFLREWQEDFPESVGDKEPASMLRFRALIAKHKGAA